jgi:8-oxo-dGTP pyrophosphatase MutT (NUDIX family)
MNTLPRAGASAVAIIETPDFYIAEGRPELPGQLVHSGKIGLFGGHLKTHQSPHDAIRDELREELGLAVTGSLRELEDGDFISQNKFGRIVLRHVTLYHLPIEDADGLTMRVAGTLVRIPKTVKGIESYENKLTDYTYRALSMAAAGDFSS